MAKFIFLFAAIILLLGAGAIVKKNPAWLQPYRKNLTTTTTLTPQTTPSVTLGNVYAHPDAGYSFTPPPGWTLKTDVPGCGPVWFPQGTTKVWLTICGPYIDQTPSQIVESTNNSGNLINSSENITVAGVDGIKQERVVEGGKTTQVYLAAPLGVIAIYFNHLEPESSRDYSQVLPQVLSTLSFSRQ